MEAVTKLEEVVENLKTLEKYLHGKSKAESDFARDLIKRAKTLLVYKLNGVNHFAPARFCGFKENTMEKHNSNDGEAGKEISPKMDKVIKGKPQVLARKEADFQTYCKVLKISAPDHERKYLRVGKTSDPYMDIANY